MAARLPVVVCFANAGGYVVFQHSAPCGVGRQRLRRSGRRARCRAPLRHGVAGITGVSAGAVCQKVRPPGAARLLAYVGILVAQNARMHVAAVRPTPMAGMAAAYTPTYRLHNSARIRNGPPTTTITAERPT